MNKDLLQSMARMWFDHIDSLHAADFIKAEMMNDLIELCYELELDNSFIDELRNDTRFKPE